MGAEVIHTVGSGQDYSTLVAWSAAQARDLVAADEYAVAELVGEHTNGTTQLDWKIDGWTTGSADTTIVRAASGNKYSDSANCDGTIDTSKALARWTTVSGDAIYFSGSANYHTFEDIQIHIKKNIVVGSYLMEHLQGGSGFTLNFKRCLFYVDDTTTESTIIAPFYYGDCAGNSGTVNFWMCGFVFHSSTVTHGSHMQGMVNFTNGGSSGTFTARCYGCTFMSIEASSTTNYAIRTLSNNASAVVKPYIINCAHHAINDTNADMYQALGTNPPTITTNLNNADGSGNYSQTIGASAWTTCPGTAATTADGGTLDLNIEEASLLYQNGSVLNIGATINGITPSGSNYSIGAWGLQASIPLGTATSTFNTHFAAGMLGVGQTGVTAPTIGNGTGSISLGGTINGVGQVFTNNTYGDLVGAQFLLTRQDDAAPETLVSKLYATDSNGDITGAALATSDTVDLVDCGALDGGAEGTAVFKFSTPYACLPLTKYGITVEASDGTTSSDFSVRTTDVAGSTGRATDGPGGWANSTSQETPVHLSFSDTATYTVLTQLIGDLITTPDTDAAIGEIRRSTD
jgi:hypothetical protein